MATHNSSSPEFKRLLRIAGIIEQNLKNNLDAETAKLCWFGDERAIGRSPCPIASQYANIETCIPRQDQVPGGQFALG
jgi:hypothetical protein